MALTALDPRELTRKEAVSAAHPRPLRAGTGVACDAHVGQRLSFVCLGVALFWAADASALESDGFALETGSPDALCPELEATREIVARRLGSLVVEGHKGWLARYTIGHAPAGNPRDFVRLELFNPQGEVELRRDLPIEGDSCRTMAEVIALVLDRYFRGLGAVEASSLQSTEPAQVVPSPSPAPVSAAPEPAHELATAPSFDLTGRGPRLFAEYAVTPGKPALGVRVSVGLGRSFEGALGLRWCMTALEESDPRGASVTAREAAVRASFAWRLALSPGLLHLGPAVTLVGQRATTDGLTQQTDRTRALWMAGVEAGFVVPFSRRLFLEASTSLDFLVPGASGQFLVDNREVLPPRKLTLGWTLGLGYAWGK